MTIHKLKPQKDFVYVSINYHEMFECYAGIHWYPLLSISLKRNSIIPSFVMDYPFNGEHQDLHN